MSSISQGSQVNGGWPFDLAGEGGACGGTAICCVENWGTEITGGTGGEELHVKHRESDHYAPAIRKERMAVAGKVGDWAFKAFTAGLGVATIYLAATFSVNVYRGLAWHSAQSKAEKEGSDYQKSE
ncbi:Uncharacterized protein Fot_29811 [Forsythia ovata]|uniref:Uncharacterized protein n=1 Tax=Forsythia ovata TaxID=205694 RepID=A0ABD1TTS4_9LAMI